MVVAHSRIRKSILFMLCMAVAAALFGFGHASRASAATKADSVIWIGKQYLGVPYQYGAPSGVTYAFDCSSYTQYVFKKIGISLPRTAAEQATKGYWVSKGNLKKGDLVFFNTSSTGKISHVGIYAGNNQMLHASSSGVKLTNMNTWYWNSKYVTARRVL